MLLVTAGTPSGFIVALSFCLGVVLVAWSEQRRIRNPRIEVYSSKENTIPEFQEDIAPDSNTVEWDIRKWFDEKFVPEAARQIGGWSLVEADIQIKSEGATSLKEWFIAAERS